MGRRDDKPHRRPPKAGRGVTVSAGPSRATSPCPSDTELSASLGYASGKGRSRAPVPQFLDVGSYYERTGTWGKKGGRRAPSPALGSRPATPLDDGSRKHRKMPVVPPSKPDNLPLAPWMRPHPFMRADDTNAIYTDQWLAFADKAFPGDIMFLGSLLLTELWLAIQMMPEDLWDGVRTMACEVLTALYEESSPRSSKTAHATIQDLWSFLRTVRFSSMDRVCEDANILIVSTQSADETDAELQGYFKQQDLKAKTLCRHLPTAAQRAKGVEPNREDDPPVAEAVDSMCWLVFFGARCAVSCNARTSLDDCKCPHHVRFNFDTTDRNKVALDDMFNLARSQAQVFFHAYLNMPVNSKAIGALNKKGIEYANKLVRRKSILSLKSIQLQGEGPTASKNSSPQRPPASLLSPKGDSAQAIDQTGAKSGKEADQSSRSTSQLRFMLEPKGSSTVAKETDIPKETVPSSTVIETTGFVARATKSSKRKVTKSRKPLPFTGKAPIHNTDGAQNQRETAKEQHNGSTPETSHSASPKPVSLKDNSEAPAPSPVTQPAKVADAQVAKAPPSADEPPSSTRKTPHHKRPSLQAAQSARSTPTTQKAVHQPVRPYFYKSTELPDNTLRLADPVAALRSQQSAQTSSPCGKSSEVRQCAEKTATTTAAKEVFVPAYDSKKELFVPAYDSVGAKMADKVPSVPAYDNVGTKTAHSKHFVPYFDAPVQLSTTYHAMAGKGYSITLRRNSYFTELLEKWKAHVASEAAKLPGSVIPPHQFMFLWKGRPLKLRETPATVGMQSTEEVYVIDSMDAAIGLRCHEAGLCNEVLRAIVCRDMMRMQQGLDPSAEGMSLSLEIGKRYEENPLLRQEERKLAAEGRLPTKNGPTIRPVAQLRTLFDRPAEEGTGLSKQPSTAQLKSTASSKSVLGPKPGPTKTTEQRLSAYQNSPARRLLARSLLESTEPTAESRPRPHSVALVSRPTRKSVQLNSPVRPFSEQPISEHAAVTSKSGESPLRPLKLVANLPGSGTPKVHRSAPSESEPESLHGTPTKTSSKAVVDPRPAPLIANSNKPRLKRTAGFLTLHPPPLVKSLKHAVPQTETEEEDVFGAVIHTPMASPNPTPKPSPNPTPKPSPKHSPKNSTVNLNSPPSAVSRLRAINAPLPPPKATLSKHPYPAYRPTHKKTISRESKRESFVNPRPAPPTPKQSLPGTVRPQWRDSNDSHRRSEFPLHDPFHVSEFQTDVYQPHHFNATVDPAGNGGWRNVIRTGIRNIWG